MYANRDLCDINVTCYNAINGIYYGKIIIFHLIGLQGWQIGLLSHSFLWQVKRQQRKVNFLITLPELYAHFMKNKMGSASMDDEDTSNILKQLEDDGPIPSSSSIDDYDWLVVCVILCVFLPFAGFDWLVIILFVNKFHFIRTWDFQIYFC